MRTNNNDMTNTTNESIGRYAEVSIANMTDIRGIKAIHADPIYGWLLLMALAVALVVIVVFLWKRRTQKSAEAVLPAETPLERARRELAQLDARLGEHGADAGFFVALSSILRQYIEGRFAVRANEMTSEEFIAFAKEADFVGGKHKNILKEFFALADLIKFARHTVVDADARASLASVRGFVEETAPQCAAQGESDL
jgi:hypothetical protein